MGIEKKRHEWRKMEEEEETEMAGEKRHGKMTLIYESSASQSDPSAFPQPSFPPSHSRVLVLRAIET